MKPKETEHLHPAIDPKLAATVRSLPKTPSWHNAWSRLGPQSTHEERLKVCLAIRDDGCLPEDIGYFLVCWAAEHLAEEEEARRPLGSNLFESVRAAERRFAPLLERCGAAEMAALFRTDLEEHDRRREIGRLFFFGPVEDEEAEDPGWLDRMLRAVADSMVSVNPVESLAYRSDYIICEVLVCPPGGQGWAVDIERPREFFDKVDGCGWYAAPMEEGDSPYLWVEGTFDGHEIFLRLLPAVETGKNYKAWRRSTT